MPSYFNNGTSCCASVSFSAGNFGGDIAFWVDDDNSVSSSNANGIFLRFVNLSRFLKLATDSLSLGLQVRKDGKAYGCGGCRTRYP